METQELEEARSQEEARERYPIEAPGIQSIQGLTTPSAETRPKEAAIQGVAKSERVKHDAPPLNPSAENDLQLAAQSANADASTFWHKDYSSGKYREYGRVRAAITENLAAQNIRNAVRSDPYSRGGNNFPNYDVFGPEEACSVKAYSFKKGGGTRPKLRTDFAELVKPDSDKNIAAAERLMWLENNKDQSNWSQLAPYLPPSVRAAVEGRNRTAVQKSLADSAALRIPQDQVEMTRKEIKKDMLSNPEKYSLDPGALPSDQFQIVNDLLNSKVKAIDERYQTAHYQSKAAEVVNLRDKELARLGRR